MIIHGEDADLFFVISLSHGFSPNGGLPVRTLCTRAAGKPDVCRRQNHQHALLSAQHDLSKQAAMIRHSRLGRIDGTGRGIARVEDDSACQDAARASKK